MENLVIDINVNVSSPALDGGVGRLIEFLMLELKLNCN